MRILHVISGLRSTAGGTVTALLGLASAQKRQGLDVAIAATFVHPEDEDAAKARALGLEVHQLGPCRNPRSRHPQMKSWIGQLARDADVVHIHGVWEEVQHHAARACQRLAVPYVMTPHGMLDPWSLSQGALKKKLYIALRMRRNFNLAAAIHFTTTTERDLVRALRFSAPAIVEPIGVDFSEFDPLPARGAFRAEHPELANHPAVIILGRLHHKKGFDLLIPAFARGAPPDARLVIAGPDDENYRATIEQLIVAEKLTDRVIFTGMLHGRGRIEALVDSDLFVLPSYQENFGIAVVEALAAGVPVVISDQVNIHQEIAESGGGEIVRAQIEPVSAAISRWLTDANLRRDAGARGRAYVRRKFDWTTIASHWVEHYARIVARKAQESKA